ncbi:hypothetical protein CH354_14990 [Leptospira levettii]|nr:hypothetical protein [Leptospira levettii]PJZ36383.1 hypothetical protein CH354_14990 [Leptospira levettii]PJZ88158.1 hypothetical protein CH368_13050 [Leptospira levettii]PJZ99329.1 hypothetical protein CH369_15375 [Leptospira levettii]
MLNGNQITSNLVFFLFISCAIDIKQVPQPRESENTIYPFINQAVYIGKFEVFTSDSVNYTKAWKYTFKSILKNNRVSNQVLDVSTDRNVNEEMDKYLIDIEVYPNFESNFNMWKTWPAFWPLTGYWPIQVRNATYEVKLLCKISVNGVTRTNMEIIENVKKTIEIYGFYRTSEIESMIEVANLKVMDRCAKEIINHLQ